MNTKFAYHKLKHYETKYAEIRDKVGKKDAHILEIGTGAGGSAEMLANIFGPQSTILSLDIDLCASGATYSKPPFSQIEFRCIDISSLSFADDMETLAACSPQKGFDVVIDDGPHYWWHQRRALKTVWPFLKSGGVYVIEDLHTTYMIRYGGKHLSMRSDLKRLFDDVHSAWNKKEQWLKDLVGVSFCDSMLILEKRAGFIPLDVEHDGLDIRNPKTYIE